jgi:predicted  nucleic acid-binding Zn-ribbon protein
LRGNPETLGPGPKPIPMKRTVSAVTEVLRTSTKAGGKFESASSDQLRHWTELEAKMNSWNDYLRDEVSPVAESIRTLDEKTDADWEKICRFREELTGMRDAYDRQLEGIAAAAASPHR